MQGGLMDIDKDLKIFSSPSALPSSSTSSPALFNTPKPLKLSAPEFNFSSPNTTGSPTFLKSVFSTTASFATSSSESEIHASPSTSDPPTPGVPDSPDPDVAVPSSPTAVLMMLTFINSVRKMSVSNATNAVMQKLPARLLPPSPTTPPVVVPTRSPHSLTRNRAAPAASVPYSVMRHRLGYPTRTESPLRYETLQNTPKTGDSTVASNGTPRLKRARHDDETDFTTPAGEIQCIGSPVYYSPPTYFNTSPQFAMPHTYTPPVYPREHVVQPPSDPVLSRTMRTIRLTCIGIVLFSIGFFVCILAKAVLSDFNAKHSNLTVQMGVEMAECARKYHENLCNAPQRPVMLADQCLKFEQCMARDPFKEFMSVSTFSLIIGDVVEQFMNALSFRSWMLVLVLLCAVISVLKLSSPSAAKPNPAQNEDRYQPHHTPVAQSPLHMSPYYNTFPQQQPLYYNQQSMFYAGPGSASTPTPIRSATKGGLKAQ